MSKDGSKLVESKLIEMFDEINNGGIKDGVLKDAEALVKLDPDTALGADKVNALSAQKSDPRDQEVSDQVKK